MNVHITNIYGFIQDQELKKKQNLYADAGHTLGFKEMGIFNFDVTTDTKSELSKRLDGIISSLQFNDLVFVQLPTGNGELYDNLLINKLRAYNTKICVLLHDQIKYDYILNSANLIMPTNNEVNAYLKEHNYSNVFYKNNINFEFSMNSKSTSILSSDFYVKKYLIDAVDQLEEPVLDEDVIHICFGLHDKDGHYSVWVGTAMQSIIDHTDSRICFHILHDETVSEENKRNLTQVAHQKGDSIKFYVIDNNEFECIKDCTYTSTKRTMFRCMLPDLLPDLSKIVYLDADIFVNRDIKELWDIDISNYCAAGVRDYTTYHDTFTPYPVQKGMVDRQNYINAGVLVLNLDNIGSQGNMKEQTLDYLINNPNSNLLDQDALNVILKDSILLLDEKWNCLVSVLKAETVNEFENKIYNYDEDVFTLYSDYLIDMKYYKTICRTPWSDYEIDNQLNKCFNRLNDKIYQYQNMLRLLSNPEVKHIFYGEENKALKTLYQRIHLKDGDYRVLKDTRDSNDDILPCKDLSTLKNEGGPFIIFVCSESDNCTAIQNLEELGFENGKNFFVIERFFSIFDGGFA